MVMSKDNINPSSLAKQLPTFISKPSKNWTLWVHTNNKI